MNFNNQSVPFHLSDDFYTTPQPNPLLEMLRIAAVNATMSQLMQPVSLPPVPIHGNNTIPKNTVRTSTTIYTSPDPANTSRNGKGGKANQKAGRVSGPRNDQNRMPLQTRNAGPTKPDVPAIKVSAPIFQPATAPISDKASGSSPKSGPASTPITTAGPGSEMDDDTVYFVQEDGKTVAKTAHGTVPLTHNIKVRKVNTTNSVVIKDANGNVIFTVEKKGVMSFE